MSTLVTKFFSGFHAEYTLNAWELLCVTSRRAEITEQKTWHLTPGNQPSCANARPGPHGPDGVCSAKSHRLHDSQE